MLICGDSGLFGVRIAFYKGGIIPFYVGWARGRMIASRTNEEYLGDPSLLFSALLCRDDKVGRGERSQAIGTNP